MLKSDQWLWGFRSEASRWRRWRPAHLASSVLHAYPWKRPALNTLLLECCLDSHAQLGLGKPQLLLGAPGKGVGWGREVEAERGPEMFSSSHVCHEVRDPLKAHRFGTQKLTLPPDYLLSNHVQISSLLPACEDSFPFPPVILLETFPGASHTLFWVLRAQQWKGESPASWSLHSAWWWAFLSHPWNKVPVSVTSLMGLFWNVNEILD